MTSRKIQILSEKVANLIAAGEVVERPASVIKELVENALDAGASVIEVEIKNAGIKYMRVTDDGCGMLPEDAQLAFSRHATSKISRPEDLEKIDTLGFRGEALPSIAAVSHLEILTRPEDQAVGYRMRLVGGEIKSQSETGCAAGTAIIVKELFYNTPARRKFMKTHATEQSHITQVVELAAIAHPQVRFKLIVDQREVFNCPATKDLEQRLAALYGRALPKTMIRVEREAGGVWISGLVGGTGDHRNTRRGMRFFINQRPVEHRGIAHAVLQAYRSLIPDGRFPVCYLFVQMPNHLVDVNVHPAKREVRLRDEQGIYHLVHAAVLTALQQSDLSGGRVEALLNRTEPASLSEAKYVTQSPAGSWSAERIKESVASYIQQKTPCILPPVDVTDTSVETEEPETLELRIVGQVGRTYIAAQDEDGFFLVDQHAAHERVLYESFKKWPVELPRQALLLPLTFELTPMQADLIKEHIDFFNEIGLEISPFGGNTFTIQTQPEPYPHGDLIGIVNEVLDWILETGREIEKNQIREKTLQSMACKAAVKAGERLQPETMLSLVQQIRNKDILPTCPHGRPYLFRISWKELDKIFKRDYAH